MSNTDLKVQLSKVNYPLLRHLMILLTQPIVATLLPAAAVISDIEGSKGESRKNDGQWFNEKLVNQLKQVFLMNVP